MTRAYVVPALAALLTLLAAGCGPAVTPSVSGLPVAGSATPPAPTITQVPAKGGKRLRGAVPPLTAGPRAGSAFSMVQAGPLLVAGTDGTGALISEDRGAHWRTMNAGLPPDPTVIAIAVEPAGGPILALVSGSVYSAAPRLPLKWRPWGAALPQSSNPQALAYWPPAHAVLVGDGSGAQFSSNAAHTPWRVADRGLPVNRAAITTLRVLEGRLYAGLTIGLATSDDGANWRMVRALAGHQITDLAALPGGGLAASLDHDGLAVRPSSTAAWSVYSTVALGLPPDERVLSLAYDPGGRRLLVGSLASGVRILHGLAPPAQSLQGVPKDDPVNGLLAIGQGLLAATNSGIIMVSRGTLSARGG